MGGVSIVVVNWNAGPALADCLASVAADGEVIVVDNGSTDGSSASVAAFPSARLIETGANLGFAAGANRGAAVAGGSTLVFLNPDAHVLPGGVAALVAALEGMPGAGIAGGGLRAGTGRWQPGAARFAPVRHLLLDTTIGRVASRRRSAPYRVDWVYGTFMAVRADLFRRLGGFDERYFVYGEDLDLCWRAARMGARTLHVPAARAVHGANLCATRRFGLGREAEVVKGEMRFYAGVGGGALTRFRVVAACKFGTKAALAGLLGRRRTAATYARVVRSCVAWQPGWLERSPAS